MKVLYDHQVFAWTRYAGIPRYFSELILALRNDATIHVTIPNFPTTSKDYLSLRGKEKMCLTYSSLLKCLNLSIDYFDKDFTRRVCYPIGKKESINLLKSNDYDVFHPTHYDPYFLKYSINKPFVTTVHDLIVEKYPEYTLSGVNCTNVRLISENATAIIADSENTKKEFVEYYDIDSDKVTVVYLASSYSKEMVEVVLPPDNIITKDYLLFVNVRNGRKNFYTMVVSIAELLCKYDIELICVGGGKFSEEEITFFSKLGVANRVKQRSVNNVELASLYKSAIALVFPSVDEGFGLPTLDAFACGCPVVLSNTSCHPEVGGDAAVYFSPKNLQSIREAVERVVSDEKLRNKMRERGYVQLKKFSWNKCAEETKKVYERAME